MAKMTRIGTILFSCVFSLLLCKSYCDFPSDYLGNYVSDEAYDKRDFCWTPVCMADSGRLIYEADHDSNKTSPCDDFKTFAMGEFYEHRVLNDRFGAIGFALEAGLQFLEKQKRMLLKPIAQSELKMSKIIKKWFQQCTNNSEK